ncbi:MAG: septum formation initiator family protein [Pseudomonadota bacterium]
MTQNRALSILGYSLAVFGLGLYFAFAAVQGDYGLFRRAEVSADKRALEIQRTQLAEDVARLENLTKRLSDGYLDLDLLDQQARDVLGYIRADELVIQ